MEVLKIIVLTIVIVMILVAIVSDIRYWKERMELERKNTELLKMWLEKARKEREKEE